MSCLIQIFLEKRFLVEKKVVLPLSDRTIFCYTYGGAQILLPGNSMWVTLPRTTIGRVKDSPPLPSPPEGWTLKS